MNRRARRASLPKRAFAQPARWLALMRDYQSLHTAIYFCRVFQKQLVFCPAIFQQQACSLASPLQDRQATMFKLADAPQPSERGRTPDATGEPDPLALVL